MNDEWASFLAPRHKIVSIIAFNRRFRVELPPRSQKISEILPSDGRIFYMDGSLCEGRVDVFHLYEQKWTGNVKRRKFRHESFRI
jgi:hypothetical protein